LQIIQRDRKKIEKFAKKNEEELKQLDAHIKELETLEKKRFKRKVEENQNEENSFTLEIQDEGDMTLLPYIDISVSQTKIQQYKQQLDAGLEQFSEKLGQLKNIALETRDEVDLQNKELGKIINKAQTEKEKIEKFNKDLKEIQNQVSLSTKLIFVFILVIVLIILALILFVYLAATIGFSIPQ
jgi:DNA repair exonuclease SbcCD ATPase subunit